MFSSNEDFSKYSISKLRNIILIGLILFILVIIVFRNNIIKTFNWYEQNKEWIKRDYEKEYFGTVTKKGRDRSNHNFAYFQFRDSTKIFDDEEKIWKRILIGDSVVKKKNSKILLIIRKDKTISISYDDIFKYRDSLMRTGNY